MKRIISLKMRNNLIFKGNYNHIVCKAFRRHISVLFIRINFPVITGKLAVWQGCLCAPLEGELNKQCAGSCLRVGGGDDG